MTIEATQIGTVELLRPRVYPFDGGDMFVEPGTYPVVWHPGGQVTFLLTGRHSRHAGTDVRELGDGLFMVRPGYDESDGDEVEFPYGCWSPTAFAELIDDPVAIERHPDQRLRFNIGIDMPKGRSTENKES